MVGFQDREGSGPPVIYGHGGYHEHTAPSGATKRPLRLFRGDLCPAVLRPAKGSDPQQPVLGSRTAAVGGREEVRNRRADSVMKKAPPARSLRPVEVSFRPELDRVVTLTLEGTPHDATHWST